MTIFEGLRINDFVWGCIGFLAGNFTGITITITFKIIRTPSRTWVVLLILAAIAGLIVALLQTNDSLDALFTGYALGVALHATQQRKPPNDRVDFPTRSQKPKAYATKQRRNKSKDPDNQQPKLFS